MTPLPPPDDGAPGSGPRRAPGENGTPGLPSEMGGATRPPAEMDVQYIREASRALHLDDLLGLTDAEESRGRAALEAILASGSMAEDGARDDGVTAIGVAAGSAAHPASREPAEAQARHEKIRAAMREVETDAPRQIAAGPHAPARRRRNRILVTSLALAAALALVFGVVVAQPFGRGAPAVAATPPVLNFEFVKAQQIATSGGTSARAALLSLATAAARQPEPARDGGIQRVVSDNWFSTTKVERDGRGHTVVVPRVVEKYVMPDGAVRTLESAAAPLSPDGRSDVGHGSRPDGPRKSDTLLAPDRSVIENAPDRLPAEPGELRRELLARSGCAAGQPGGSATEEAAALCLYTGATDLYQTWVVSPRLESSLWKVLAGEPGIGYLGSVRDRLGRDGVGFSAFDAENNTRRVLIVNPRTGRLLGTEEILTKALPKAGVKAPAVLAFTALVSADWVTTQPPRAPDAQQTQHS